MNVVVFSECNVSWSSLSHCGHHILCLRLRVPYAFPNLLPVRYFLLLNLVRKKNTVPSQAGCQNSVVLSNTIQSLRLCLGICLDSLHGRLGIHSLIPGGLTPHLHGPPRNQFEIINWTKLLFITISQGWPKYNCQALFMQAISV